MHSIHEIVHVISLLKPKFCERAIFGEACDNELGKTYEIGLDGDFKSL